MKTLPRALPSFRSYRRRTCVPSLRMTRTLRWLTEGRRSGKERP